MKRTLVRKSPLQKLCAKKVGLCKKTKEQRDDQGAKQSCVQAQIQAQVHATTWPAKQARVEFWVRAAAGRKAKVCSGVHPSIRHDQSRRVALAWQKR